MEIFIYNVFIPGTISSSKRWRFAVTSLHWVNLGNLIPVASTLYLVVKVTYLVSQVTFIWILLSLLLYDPSQ